MARSLQKRNHASRDLRSRLIESYKELIAAHRELVEQVDWCPWIDELAQLESGNEVVIRGFQVNQWAVVEPNTRYRLTAKNELIPIE